MTQDKLSPKYSGRFSTPNQRLIINSQGEVSLVTGKLEKIQKEAVSEAVRKSYPGKPIISRDPFPNQYGIPKEYFNDLVNSIKQGSGKIEK